jgi:hypothetical protein
MVTGCELSSRREEFSETVNILGKKLNTYSWT